MVSDEDRLAFATEAERSAQEAGDAQLIMMGHVGRLDALLGLGDIASIEGETDICARLAKELRQPSSLYFVEITRYLQPLWEGKFEEAEMRVQRAAAVLAESGITGSFEDVAAQIFAIRREQGRLQELEGAVAGFVKMNPAPIWRAALAFLYSEIGREVEARDEFERLAESGFDGLARVGSTSVWTSTLALLSETCSVLGDANRALLLYELLKPVAGSNLFLGIPMNRYAYLGCASRTLGLLATTFARWTDAQQHFDDALNMHTRMGARPWVARTQLDYARMRRKRNAAGDSVRARELLEQALATAQEIGMAKVAADCEALLASAP